jgi:hypothetical protein
MNREKITLQNMRISTNIFKELRYGKLVREFLSTILFIYLFIVTSALSPKVSSEE